MCLEVAQNLASELGIVVYVDCADPANGKTTVVAECCDANERHAGELESFYRERLGQIRQRVRRGRNCLARRVGLIESFLHKARLFS